MYNRAVPKSRWQTSCISFTSSFVLLIHSAMPDAASGWLQHPDTTGQASSRTPALPKLGYLFCAPFKPFLLSMHQPKKGSPPPLGGAAHPLNYNHTIKFLPLSTHYIQGLSQIYLVASRLYFLLILTLGSRKHKVRAGE